MQSEGSAVGGSIKPVGKTGGKKKQQTFEPLGSKPIRVDEEEAIPRHGCRLFSKEILEKTWFRVHVGTGSVLMPQPSQLRTVKKPSEEHHRGSADQLRGEPRRALVRPGGRVRGRRDGLRAPWAQFVISPLASKLRFGFFPPNFLVSPQARLRRKTPNQGRQKRRRKNEPLRGCHDHDHPYITAVGALVGLIGGFVGGGSFFFLRAWGVVFFGGGVRGGVGGGIGGVGGPP